MSQRRAHRASIIKYEWHSPVDDSGCYIVPCSAEAEIDVELARLQDEGFVEDYDTGRGGCVWFTCPAGARARALRDWVGARVPMSWTTGGGR